MRGVSHHSRARASVRDRVCAGLVLLVALLWHPASAHAKVEHKHVAGPFNPPEMALGPPNQEFKDVKPGAVLHFQLFVQNRLNMPLDIALETKDAEGSNDPDALIDVVRKGKYGAGDWITLEAPTFHLESGDSVIQDVTITVPPDVGGGSWYGAIQATTTFKAPDGSIRLDKRAGLNSIVLIDMAGDAKLGGRIRDISSGRFATHGARTVVPFDAVWENTGNVTDSVAGKIKVKSIFGTTALTTSFRPAIVVRGGTRSFHVVWDDVPWIGLFHPQVILTGRDGKPHARYYPWVLVLPPWYYIVAVVLAALFPVWRWWANRRKWAKLYAELYGEDEDWDDEDWDEDDEDWA